MHYFNPFSVTSGLLFGGTAQNTDSVQSQLGVVCDEASKRETHYVHLWKLHCIKMFYFQQPFLCVHMHVLFFAHYVGAQLDSFSLNLSLQTQ